MFVCFGNTYLFFPQKREILDESGNEARLNEVFDSNAGMHRTRTMSTWAVVVVLLCFVSEQCTSGGNPVKLLQLTAQGFKEHVQTGKTSLIYFGKGGEVSCTCTSVISSNV